MSSELRPTGQPRKKEGETISEQILHPTNATMKNGNLINQDSGNVEWYTPPEIIEAARKAMGGIDLDPASCVEANKRVMATTIFTKEESGLAKQWFGRVWMNHPFGRENKRWIDNLCYEYRIGRVTQACCITFASTSERWFRPLLDFPQCYLHGRTRYIGGGDSPPKGSVVTYLGHNVEGFYEAFREMGTIKVDYKQLSELAAKRSYLFI